MPFEPAVVVSASSLERAQPATVDAGAIARAVTSILTAIGEDPGRTGLRETPHRVAESYAELFSGYGVDPVSVLEPLPGEHGEGLIMVRAIDVVSFCEHHLLPFTGTASVAYLPSGPITGLSKLARVVDVLAHRLQVQERLVREIADALEAALSPRGVFVLVEAEHLCMSIRGARKPGSVTVTTDARGELDDPATRAELLALARG
ncbi:MAG: GTP cyclohydrolase I FolE [Actinomycetota bacterium]